MMDFSNIVLMMNVRMMNDLRLFINNIIMMNISFVNSFRLSIFNVSTSSVSANMCIIMLSFLINNSGSRLMSVINYMILKTLNLVWINNIVMYNNVVTMMYDATMMLYCIMYNYMFCWSVSSAMSHFVI